MVNSISVTLLQSHPTPTTNADGIILLYFIIYTIVKDTVYEVHARLQYYALCSLIMSHLSVGAIVQFVPTIMFGVARQLLSCTLIYYLHR